MTAHLGTVGWHAPKHFPKSPSELLRKSTPKKSNMTNPAQVAAIFGQLLGKPVTVAIPSAEEVDKYG